MANIATILAAGLGAALLGGPAAAAGKFAAPEGCEVYATIQTRNCQVTQHYRCSADAEGDQWTAFLDEEGPFYLSRIDSETRWIESYDLMAGESDRLTSETDPASFTTLITTGRDDYDFYTESNTGEVRRYSGTDALTGETVTIDGVPFERTTFDLTAWAADGSKIWNRTGKQLIQRDWRIFMSDREEIRSEEGATEPLVETPVDIARPGDKGYLAAEPIYDCGMTMTGLDAQVIPVRGGQP